MTDLPKEDRDLIERVLGKDEVRWLARIGCNTFSVEMVAKLLAAARSDGRAEAPVVDDAVIAKALQAFNQQSDGAPDGDFTAQLHTRVARMTTSRDGPTKFEHYAQLVRGDGRSLDLWMRHSPAEALFHAMEVALFLGVPCEPLVVDGQAVELDETMKAMLPDLTEQIPPAPEEHRHDPIPPWPVDLDNAKREGWRRFFAGFGRDACPFPPARQDLHRDFRFGWDAAQALSTEGGDR